MINVQEHIYDDDPKLGHPDVRTRLKGANYFFLGNGRIQAAVQFAREGEGTPVGLLILRPDLLGKKRDALNFDPLCGLEKTQVVLMGKKNQRLKTTPDQEASWCFDRGLPSVRIQRSGKILRVFEEFYCPSQTEPWLIREVRIQNRTDKPLDLMAATQHLKIPLSLEPGEEKPLILRYLLTPDQELAVEFLAVAAPEPDAQTYWSGPTRIESGSELLDRFFDAARFQLPAVVSDSGKVDASVWQYNREWVRDHSFMGIGLILSGHHRLGGVLLERLVREFVTEAGDTIDSSQRRDPSEVELDQNGLLLSALTTYYLWTGDLDLIQRNWERIQVLAGFPLKPVFRHGPSGLLYNQREYWERHKVHGIENGIELTYQLYAFQGLFDGAVLARALDREEIARRWEAEGARLKKAFLHDPIFALHERGRFIKRRDLDGAVQERILPQRWPDLPEEAPLSRNGDHLLNPDASSALPIALGVVPPDSRLARETLAHLETLWNQEWSIGGYGRYHTSSDPDCAGPWPFASLFIARAYAELGDDEKIWRVLHWLGALPGANSGAWFEVYGERISPPFPQVGITPWTWAEMIQLVVHHLLGVRPEEGFLRIRPRMLSGLSSFSADFLIRGKRLRLNLKPGKTPTEEIRLPYPSQDISVDLTVPSR